ncbi:MAG: hypothetical protein DWQ06_07245 [Calditrichaeota bacterium]|nr:MAG: hypothetical protein DWQ06_07245 [Calditrichota bacterium]
MQLLITIFLLIFMGFGETVFSQQQDDHFRVGAYGSLQKLIGDDADYNAVRPLLGVNLGYNFTPKYSIELSFGYGWSVPRDENDSFPAKYYTRLNDPNFDYETTLFPLNLNFKYNFRTDKKWTPYVVAGTGMLFWHLSDNKSGNTKVGSQKNILGTLGGGTEWFFHENWALDLSLRYSQLFGQDEDMAGYNDKNNGLLQTRAGLNFYFQPSKDSDRDGIVNSEDACPNEPEDVDGFEDFDGCPESDNDKDGYLDAEDKCPNLAEDFDGFEDSDGCPDEDNDKDGILDIADKCPNEAEDFDGFEDSDGCPDVDNDKDGILDVADKCPNEAETLNGFEDSDGCPDTKPQVELSPVLEDIYFDNDKFVLKGEALVKLNKLVKTLKDFTDIDVEIGGNTDSVGSSEYNQALSERRANSVKEFLIRNGISAIRIETKGYGEENPIAPNNTPEGRAKNRRVTVIRVN